VTAPNSRPTAIEALAADPSSGSLVLDFDGVLSPIVEDPSTSAMPDRVTAILTRLARVLGLVAVISGRPTEFLADRVRVPGVTLLGSYGIEQFHDGMRQVDPEAGKWLGQVREASRALRDLLARSPGIWVEEKSVSVAVHWRRAPDRATAAAEVRRVTARVAAETGLSLEPGKLVEELRPPISMNKGLAISALLAAEKPAVAVYVGDDLGDIPALRAVREAGGYALVVDHGPETDPRLLELADEIYAGPEGFADWLSKLADTAGA
jgi:trehalose 6-phosphate phosphatase